MDEFAYSFADGDTPVTALSWEAATCAAGTVIAAVDAVCSGAKVNAFCAGWQLNNNNYNDYKNALINANNNALVIITMHSFFLYGMG